MARVSAVDVPTDSRADPTLSSYEVRGEGCQEEVNVDVHHTFSPFYSSRIFSSFTSRQAYHTSFIVPPS